MKIETYATLRDVKSFKPGTHNDETYTDEEIEEMVRDSNECLEYILQSIEKGFYPENNFVLDKQIPGILNIEHQRLLPETIKNAVKDAKIEWKKTGEWVTATISNVKDEIAQFLQTGFPFRSVEIVKNLYNPLTKKTYKNVLRSLGFLQANPAVPQEPGYAVEYSRQEDSPILVLYSHAEEQPPTQGEYAMTKETPVIEKSTPDIEAAAPVSPGIPVEEYEALKAHQAEQTTTIQELQSRMKAVEQEKADMKTRLDKEQATREAQEISIYCDRLIHEGQASPAFIELISPHLIHADHSEVVEFSEEKKSTRREALQELFSGIVELSKKQSIVAPLGKPLEFGNDDPMKPADSPEDKHNQMIAEFEDAAKAQAKNPNDAREVFNIAHNLALAKYGDALE